MLGMCIVQRFLLLKTLKDICSESGRGRDVSSASSILGSPASPALLLLEGQSTRSRPQAASSSSFHPRQKKRRGAILRSSVLPPDSWTERYRFPTLQSPEGRLSTSLASGETPWRRQWQPTATHPSVPAWRGLWTEEPSGRQSTGHKASDTTEWLALSNLGPNFNSFPSKLGGLRHRA